MEIRLTHGFVAVINDQDIDIVGQHLWRTRKGKYTWYAETGHRGVKMHNLIMSPPPGIQVDHINRNGLDNRRANLRLATHQEQMRNRKKFANSSSRYKGVTWHKGSKKWQANIRVDGKLIYLGKYVHEQDAALAYDAAAKHYFGEFADPNF
jgi:hypothetical protein